MYLKYYICIYLNNIQLEKIGLIPNRLVFLFTKTFLLDNINFNLH